MVEKYIVPKRILKAEAVVAPERLLEKRPLQTNFTSDDCAVIRRGGSVLLDFGKELNGGIVISVQQTSRHPSASRCRLVFGESVMEALSSIGYKNATNDHSVRDTTIEVYSMSTVKYGTTGFRFVKMEAVDADLWIKAISAEPDIKDIAYRGCFECSDVLLNEIWKTGAYTVHLNMHEFVWDGIKRDRLVWLGDMHPEVATIRAVFGYDDSVVNSLEFAKAEYPPTKWINRYPSYSMWWIIIQYDWYLQNGDLAYLRAQESYISQLAESIAAWVRNGEKPQREIFVDWSSCDNPEYALTGMYAVAYKAMCAAKEIFKITANGTMAEKCQELAQEIKGMALSAPDQKQIAGLCAYSGLCDSHGINADILSKEPLQGLSTFLGYYVLHARAMAGDVQGALDVIRGYWGAMLQLGATTFWEDFDIRWMENAARIDELVPEGKVDVHGDCGKHCYQQFRHSLCHGWASGPTAFLSEYVLGVHVVGPGCKKIEIKPNLCDLTWVKGTYPTPYGNVCIEHKTVGGKVVSTVSAPEEVEISM